jgi:hypothetical protein
MRCNVYLTNHPDISYLKGNKKTFKSIKQANTYLSNLCKDLLRTNTKGVLNVNARGITYLKMTMTKNNGEIYRRALLVNSH